MHLLFVCTGNTCRSPLAEAIARRLAHERGLQDIIVSSAGTTFCMNADGMERRIRAAGFKAARRNVRYDWLTCPS